MRDREIEQLLRCGEVGYEPPSVPNDLARQARTLDRRRKRIRNCAALASAAIVALGGVGAWKSSNVVRVATTPTLVEHTTTLDHAALAFQIAETESQLRVAQKVVELLQQDRELATARRVVVEGDPAFEVTVRLDEVAYQMLCRADELREAMPPESDASVVYQDVIKLFPATNSAAAARQRLAGMADQNGEPSCDPM